MEVLGIENVGIHIVWPIGIFDSHLLHFVVIWYIFPCFGMFYVDKSGNPGANPKTATITTTTHWR
jgi:hypothetical protein